MRESRAYGLSIYLMLGMPVASLGIFSFLVYRGLRKNAQVLAARAAMQAGSTEAAACPYPRAEGS